MSKSERHAIDFMLNVLGFQGIRLKWVGFHQTTQSFGRYEALRQRGYQRADALYRLLYG